MRATRYDEGRTMARRKLTIDDAGAIAAALPGVTEGTSYGTRGWKVGKKFLMREKERMDDVLVLKLASVDEQELLIERDPGVFFITDHYKGWPAVLVRLGAIDRKALASLIEGAWRAQATKKILAERA
jgi:hypothetical protein